MHWKHIILAICRYTDPVAVAVYYLYTMAALLLSVPAIFIRRVLYAVVNFIPKYPHIKKFKADNHGYSNMDLCRLFWMHKN